jgi:acetate kinase
MRILVFNAGSSSLKFGVFDVGDAGTSAQVFKGSFDRFTPVGCTYRHGVAHPITEAAPYSDIAQAVVAVPALLSESGVAGLDAIGHRIAHGGAEFAEPALLDMAALARIEALTPLAPLHNPANLAAVVHAQSVWPDLPHWGVFDTSFHLSAPARATTYAVPQAWRDKGVRRYGFHGTSHKYVAQRAAQALGQRLERLRIVSLHLGNGASACAIAGGVSVDSSMGMTPLEGLVMGTRSGDVDPGLFGFLHRQMELDVPAIEQALNNDSGLLALAGVADMRAVEMQAAEGDRAAQLAINITAYRARKYIGAYAAAMGGIDVLAFTGGIGENSSSMRRRICDGLAFLGIALDDDRNTAPDLSNGAAPHLQAHGAPVAVLVMEAAEQQMIAQDVAHVMARNRPALDTTIPVAVSARHVHLSADAVAALFGPDTALTPDKPLRQKGHWVARERVTLQGPRGQLENVAILGPLRQRTQIEVSRTDSFALGLDAPLRQSGHLDTTPRLRLIGPAGVHDTDGLIIAARHIHMGTADAARLSLQDGDEVDVTLGATGRDLTFDRVLVRVSANASTEMHIDTDEANAAGIRSGAEGDIVLSARVRAKV